MSSVILSTTARFLLPLLLLFSISLLLRGHDGPGGGFAGGLVAAATFTLYSFSADVRTDRRLLRVDVQRVTGLGLLLATGVGALPLLSGRPFLAGAWRTVRLPLLGEIDLGTPLLFDVGVYLVVTGVTLSIIFAQTEEPR